MPLVRFLAIGLGKLLSKVFGLATMSFFGRMPSRDDDRIALIGVASLTWLATAIAAAVPAVAEMMIPFVDDDAVARWTAVVLTVAMPPAIGGLVASLHNHRGEGVAASAGHVVRGYLYTAVVSLTVTALVIVVPLVMASYLVRRFAVVRCMVMIPDGAYDRTVDHLREVLASAGIEAEVEEPNRLIAWLFRWLGWVLGYVFARQVPGRMQVLRGTQDDAWFEITVHAADLTIVGHRWVAHLVRARLVEGIDERVLYFTWDDDAQALEERIRGCRADLEAGRHVPREALDEMIEDLAHLQLDGEAWDSVRRLIYRLERDAAGARRDRTPTA
jgi:hypothetical protein